MKKGEDFIGVTVVYLCHDGKGNILMSKRGLSCRDEQGKWDIGGGAMEFGDTIDFTLRKEIKEEYSTDVISYDFLGFRDVHRENEGKKTHWIALDFKVLVDKEKVKNGEPHKFDEVKWFDLKHLPEVQHSQLSKFWEQHKGKI
jgi:ADP-ribose pyrophosphatase YjhB (NUDIX family)